MFQAYLNFRKTLVKRYGYKDILRRNVTRVRMQLNIGAVAMQPAMLVRASVIIYKWLEEKSWRFNTGTALVKTYKSIHTSQIIMKSKLKYSTYRYNYLLTCYHQEVDAYSKVLKRSKNQKNYKIYSQLASID